MKATKRPDRDEYRPPSRSDLAAAIRSASEDDGWSHHRVGRYTATQTFTEHEPDAKPGDKTRVVRVTECEREIIGDFPVEHIGGVLDVLAGPDDVSRENDGGEP